MVSVTDGSVGHHKGAEIIAEFPRRPSGHTRFQRNQCVFLLLFTFFLLFSGGFYEQKGWNRDGQR